MTTILDPDGMPDTADRGLCVVCVEQPRALPRLSRCWACIKLEADRHRQHKPAATTTKKAS